MPAPASPIPDWYLALSTVFMAIVALLFVGLCILIWNLTKAVKRIEPQVTNLLGQVNGEILPQVKGLVVKVNDLTENVNQLAGSAKGTVKTLGERADTVSAAIQALTGQSVAKVQGLAPYVGLAMTVMKLVQGYASTKKALDSGDRTPAKVAPKRRRRRRG
jgi:uncharacterized protein YoxC